MRRLTLAFILLAFVPGTPAGALRPAPAVSIFYYPWYGTPAVDGTYTHWAQQWHLPPADIASNYYPADGIYSSGSPATLDRQMREIAGAGVGEVVSSWWGWGSVEDTRLPLVIAAAHARGLSVAVQIEPYDGRSAESVATDIVHLQTLGITRFYVYHPFEVPDQDWPAAIGSLSGVELLAETGNPARAAVDGFQGVYTYDILTYGAASFRSLCARARAVQLICAPSVGPGYEAIRATGDARVRPRLNGATYDGMWRAAIRAGAGRITITSYNEWHEGTQVEPARARPIALRARDMSPVELFRYQTYDGAYGLHGNAARDAYLARTAMWAAKFGSSPHR
jgi:hypothetical protein